jgi:hypothetical protein
MLINGNGLMKKIVKLVEKENDIMKQTYDLSERFASAENLKNSDEMQKISMQGNDLNRKTMNHCLEKSVVMSMIIVTIPNFRDN